MLIHHLEQVASNCLVYTLDNRRGFSLVVYCLCVPFKSVTVQLCFIPFVQDLFIAIDRRLV